MSQAEKASLEKGLAAHSAGRLDESDAAYREVLNSDGEDM